MTLEEFKWLRGYTIASNEGDPCECEGIINSIGRGHLLDCSNRKPHDTRRRISPQQVAKYIAELGT